MLPILIIPGFMSSGLEIKESKVRPNWEGKRLWLNLQSLGFSALHFGSALRKSTIDGADQGPSTVTDDEAKNVQYKSAWLQHMSLQTDMQTEHRGVRVRAIQGLEGVDYLTPGALTNHVSYVFGPLIDALLGVGYNRNPNQINLSASPYDWRLPPRQMEARDSYFSKTIGIVETMYNENDNSPVVLLSHSLGTKVAHYFLNFCLRHKGQEWLDRHIHTYMPVGAPHLGAPKAVRSVITGDKMSLDAFLSDEEAMSFGRSLGSGLWLFPQQLPLGAPSTTFVRKQQILEVKICGGIEVEPLVKDRRSVDIPKQYQLIVAFGPVIATTEFHRPSEGYVSFPETFIFSTMEEPLATMDLKHRSLQVYLQEPGVSVAKKEDQPQESKTAGSYKALCSFVAPFRIICCLWTFDVFFKLIYCFLNSLWECFIYSADVVTSASGGTTNLACTHPINIDAVWHGDQPLILEAELIHRKDPQRGLFAASLNKHDTTATFKTVVKLQVTRKMPITDEGTVSRCSAISRVDDKTEALVIYAKSGSALIESLPGNITLRRECLDKMLEVVRDVYDSDDLDPRGGQSAADAPPVKRVKAIYGVNLPTEVGAVYKLRKSCIETEGNAGNRHKLDTHATINTETGFIVKGGILMETKETRQRVVFDERYKDEQFRNSSGDGTVPYWSLQHVNTWSNKCVVDIDEIEGADHREILADPRFHDVVIAYVREEPKDMSDQVNHRSVVEEAV